MTSEPIRDVLMFHARRLTGDSDATGGATAALLLAAFDSADHVDALVADLRYARDEIAAAIESVEEVR